MSGYAEAAAMRRRLARGVEKDLVLKEIRRREERGRHDETKTLRREPDGSAASNTRRQIQESQSTRRQQAPARACAAPGKHGKAYRRFRLYAHVETRRRRQSRAARLRPAGPAHDGRSFWRKYRSQIPIHFQSTPSRASLDGRKAQSVTRVATT